MIQALIGIKLQQTQRFLEDGTRIPVTRLGVSGTHVVQRKTTEKDGYNALQIGIGNKKKISKPLQGHIKGAKLEKAPFYFREIRVDEFEESDPEVGTALNPQEILKPGDKVDVIGVSKGKGFAGGVKRYGFKGGPRTHGQSDRERAPGSIGQTTTPGRVYRGKRMAGRMGHLQATVKNLTIVDVSDTELSVDGLVPGGVNSVVMIKKIGEDKKYVPLFKEIVEEPEEVAVEASSVQETQVKEVSKEEPVEEVQASKPQEASEPQVEAPQEAPEPAKEQTDVEGKDKNAS